jgi:hypothetical protein
MQHGPPGSPAQRKRSVGLALRIGKPEKRQWMCGKKRRHAAWWREADCDDLGVELLKRFELQSHLAEVGAAGDSGEVA